MARNDLKFRNWHYHNALRHMLHLFSESGSKPLQFERCVWNLGTWNLAQEGVRQCAPGCVCLVDTLDPWIRLRLRDSQ